MPDTVLCLNAGSSSIKFKVFEAAGDRDPTIAIQGQLEGIGGKPHLSATDGDGKALAR
jgi:acetate kinase